MLIVVIMMTVSRLPRIREISNTLKVCLLFFYLEMVATSGWGPLDAMKFSTFVLIPKASREIILEILIKLKSI